MSSLPASRGRSVEPWNVQITPKMIKQVSVVCFIAWVASVYDFTLFGTLLPVIAEEFGWSTIQATAINTYATIGVFIVSLLTGTIIDRMGRKKALMILMIGGAVASGLTGAVIGAVSLVIVRSFSGFSMSEEVVNAVYLNEIYKEAKSKGLMYSLVQGGWPVGALASAGSRPCCCHSSAGVGASWWPRCCHSSSWCSPAACRSPRRSPQCRRSSAAAPPETSKAPTQLATEHDLEEGAHHATGVKDVFTPELRRHTIFLSLAWFFNWIGIQVFSVLGTTILVNAKGVSFDNALVILVLANAVGFGGYVFHGWLGDKITRKRTVVLGWLAGGICSLVMLMGPGTSGFIIPMYALTLFFLTGPYAALLFYMGESFPAHVRGMGANVAHVMAPVGGIAGSGLLTILLASGVDVALAAIITGTGGLIASALCMAGTHSIRDIHQRTTVIA